MRFRYPNQITLELSSTVLFEINKDNWTQFHIHKAKNCLMTPDEVARYDLFYKLIRTLVYAKKTFTWFDYGRMYVKVNLEDEEAPAMITIGDNSATLYCATRTGEVEFEKLTDSEYQFLDSLELLLDTIATR